jgi:four helix bundle protein
MPHIVPLWYQVYADFMKNLRNSRKEYLHFLYIARGSLYETLTLLEIFEMRKWMNSDQFSQLESQANEIGKMINGLIRSISQT